MAQVRKRIVELVTKVTGSTELKKTETALRRIDKSTAAANKQLAIMNKRTKAAAVSMGKLVGLAATFAGAKVFTSIIRSTVEQEQAVKQLNAALISTNNTVGKTTEELQALATQMQDVTSFGDEAVIGAEALLLTFKQIQGVNFDRTLESILDVSTAMGQDLKSSTVQLGKALNDPIAGLSALSRIGITFTDEQEKVIKSLAETGRVAEAQVKILEELESQFGGSARAAQQTLGGALDSLSNAFGDLLEASEGGVTPLTTTVNELAATFKDPAFKTSVNEVVNDILRLASTGLTTMTNFGDIVGFVSDEVKALYGVVNEQDLARLYEKQLSLQERLNREGFFGLIQNTTGLAEELEEVNAQIAETERRINELAQLQPINVTATRVQERNEVGPLPTALPAVEEVQGASQLFIDLKNNMEWLEQHAGQAADATALAQSTLNDQLARSNELFAKYNPAVATYQNEMFDLNEALNQGVISQEQFIEKSKELDETLAQAQEGWSLGEEAATLFGDSINTMLDGVLQGTQSVSEGFKDMAKVMLAQLAKLAAFSAIANLFPGTSIGNAAAGLLPSANGNVFQGGNVKAFAKGGVVNNPTIFPMANGAGLMGEAGPEAIMPLSRNSSGQLGVSGGGINVTVNNNAPGVSVDTGRDSNGGLTLDIVMANVTAAIDRGGNPVSTALERNYSLGRGRGNY